MASSPSRPRRPARGNQVATPAPTRVGEVRTTRCPAMGTDAEITTDASEVAVAVAHSVIASLDRRWSRLLPASDLSRLNHAGGPMVARPSTARAIEIALAGARLTRGWFDPTRGTHPRAAGHRRTMTAGRDGPAEVPARRGTVAFDGETGVVDVPEGIELDLGGLAKGLAADIVAALLREGRATQAGVSIGGDIRICSDTRVLVEVDAPDGGNTAPALIGLCDGGIAVSGPTRRRTIDGRHRLIDPFTGRPVQRPRVATVVAASAAGAEMLATAAAIAPLDVAVEIITSAGATAWLIEQEGTVTAIGEPERFLVAHGWMGERSS